jgi:hypothetical protein
LPKPIVDAVNVNGHSVHALLDSSSCADFMLSTLADQLKLAVEALAKPQPVQLAITSSTSGKNEKFM